ncbi:hypothetical protein GGTG_14012 [Gaeumannomyces tritici R3-111a-1]|uniref:Uncharacterized protein n=1 Tax=Gaeumannomyces tritici (strain R3-111a-1) TaxID=644352 RepID=J3PKF8_GAET3|nr:hypothetical protein GGTG_14012 [Gaeumannomyces tritici R3-111a-1]EJT68411.1 hypothetical protein GGTG_14012 [Gaeumannomyces tritici R3-111a-1]
MVKAEPRCGSEEPWRSSPSPAASSSSSSSSSSAASTPSSASFTPAMSPAGPSRAAGSDVGDSDAIDIKMEMVEEKAGIVSNSVSPAPPRFHPANYHQSLSLSQYPMSTWQAPPPVLGWAAWMAPPSGLYPLHRLNTYPHGPMSMSDTDMAYALALPRPKSLYLPHECAGLAGGPSLMAFHCHMLQFRLPKLRLHGKSIRDLGFEYLDAKRRWNMYPNDDILGIATERLAWRAMVAIMSFREEDHVANFVSEVHEAIAGCRPDLPTRHLEAGLHGTLSMIRLMRQWCREPAAVRMAEELAVELVWRLNFDYVGYVEDGTLCGADGGMRAIFTDYCSIEDDLGLLAEITSFFPEGARECRGVRMVTFEEDGLPDGITYETKIAILINETITLLEERTDCVNWPREVAEHCARYVLRRGPWYAYSCLWHLDRWLWGSSRASERLKDRVSAALRLVSQHSHDRRFPPVPAPEKAPVTKCGDCGCHPNPPPAFEESSQ